MEIISALTSCSEQAMHDKSTDAIHLKTANKKQQKYNICATILGKRR